MRRGHDHIQLIRTAGEAAILAHALKCGDLIPQTRSALEIQRFGGLFHLGGKFAREIVALAFEQAHGFLDVAHVVLGGNKIHARRRAAADLMLQTRPLTVRKKDVRTRPQAEQLLQGHQRFAH